MATDKSLPIYQTPATVETTHQMIIAIIIMGGVGMLLVIFAGESKTAGNTIAGFLGLILLVQGITKVNPFISFLTSNPLTPQKVAPPKGAATVQAPSSPTGRKATTN